MIRIAAFIAVAVLVFCGTLLGAAYLSGNISQDDLRALFGEAPEPPQEEAPKRDDLSAMARMLQDRQEDLDERAALLDEREKRLIQQEADLNALKREIESIQAEVKASLDTADQEREAEVTEVADSMASMDPVKAADALTNLLRNDPEMAVKVVKVIPTRQRGKILNEMQPEDSSALFNETLEPAY